MEKSIELQKSLRTRAEIRRQAANRKSVMEGKPDRLCNLLEEAADYIKYLTEIIEGKIDE